MNDNIEVKIIATVMITVVSLIALAVIYHIHRNYLIAIADNPIATACALSDSDAKPCMAYLGSMK